ARLGGGWRWHVRRHGRQQPGANDRSDAETAAQAGTLMAQIIQAYRRPSPIADAVREAAQSYFGNRMQTALQREQLSDMRSKQEAYGQVGQTFGPDAEAWARAGLDLGDTGLFAAAQAPTLDPYSVDAARAQMGAGVSASGWGTSFSRDQARQQQTDAARLAEQQRAQQAALAQNQGQ